MDVIRCAWSTSLPIYIEYHDAEWGVPIRDDDVRLFEFLTLEGAQAGLSWLTILRKRDAYRAAFDGFDPALVAAYDDAKIAALLQDPGIVRNRLKINSTVMNARAVLELQGKFGSFSNYLWGFVDGQPIQNHWQTMGELPAETELSRKISKDLSKRGFKFVGSTIIYSLMQAVGMVNDHTADCFRHDEVARL